MLSGVIHMQTIVDSEHLRDFSYRWQHVVEEFTHEENNLIEI